MDVTQKIQEQLKSNFADIANIGGRDGGAITAACFGFVNIFEDPELREALKQYSNWPTYPQLYVSGELVGGSDIITEMYRKGELQQLLTEAGASGTQA